MKEVNLTAIHLLNEKQVICVVNGVVDMPLLVNGHLWIRINGALKKRKIEGVEILVGMGDKEKKYTEIGILINLERGVDYDSIGSLRNDNIGTVLIDFS